MSEEQYSSMDECTLRTLLEATLDLAERRQIRTAIRELRRKELEGYEEALASKRFRSEKSSELVENKENRPRSQEIADDQTTPNAFQLAKLEAIKDVEELTTLVRYLKIIEKSGYQALPWVRYITQNGDYQLRTQ